MEYLTNITLDLSAKNDIQIVEAKQGDRIARALLVAVTKDGSDYIPSDYSYIMFRCQKPDGHAVVVDSRDEAGIAVSGTQITIPIPAQALVADGKAFCDVAFIDSEGNVLSTEPFIMDVNPSPNITNTLVSTDDFQRLQQAISMITDATGSVRFRASDGYFQVSYNGGETWSNISLLSELFEGVTSVNGHTGDVELDAESVGALSEDTELFSGDYNDLENKPTLFSGDYNDLENKPNLDGKLNKPSTDGTSGQVLTSDGQGGEYWSTPSGGGGSSGGSGIVLSEEYVETKLNVSRTSTTPSTGIINVGSIVPDGYTAIGVAYLNYSTVGNGDISYLVLVGSCRYDPTFKRVTYAYMSYADISSCTVRCRLYLVPSTQ